MKRVVSVSLGSPSGDFVREVEIGGQLVQLSREGVGTDMERAKRRIRELDGQVDAIGLGGIDIYLYVGGEQFIIGDGKRLAEEAKKTPVLDGSGLKNTLERRVVRELAARGVVDSDTSVLMPSAMDRFGMAEEFVKLGCRCVFGDLIFNIGFNYPLTTLAEIEGIARKYRTRLLTVPFHMLYPTGAAQDASEANPLYATYYEAADVIAGDSHLILRHLPERIEGKGIVTNTTRAHTLRRFAVAGAKWVATTTPDLGGVSAGTNLMEATLVALMGKSPSEIAPSDYEEWIERLDWRGAFHTLTGDE
jgi:hypothetical protein